MITLAFVGIKSVIIRLGLSVSVLYGFSVFSPHFPLVSGVIEGFSPAIDTVISWTEGSRLNNVKIESKLL